MHNLPLRRRPNLQNRLTALQTPHVQRLPPPPLHPFYNRPTTYASHLLYQRLHRPETRRQALRQQF